MEFPAIYHGYKVVYAWHNVVPIFWSASYQTIPCVMCYEIGRPTKRPAGFGPLAVFDDLDFALHFRSVVDIWGLLIFECDYVPSGDETLWFIIHSGARVETKILPRGTRFANEVTITRRVA